jgi:membrane-associated phospholipid phosphatase
VHYPSDVLAGAALGALVGRAVGGVLCRGSAEAK